MTEIVTGIDLVKEQIRLAAGEKLGYDKDDVKILGHAIECRINAEDPDYNFAPCPGKITGLVVPGGPGVRLEGSEARLSGPGTSVRAPPRTRPHPVRGSRPQRGPMDSGTERRGRSMD